LAAVFAGAFFVVVFLAAVFAGAFFAAAIDPLRLAPRCP
jgi:hypothetical protein